MLLDEIIQQFKNDYRFRDGITCHLISEGNPAEKAPLPEEDCAPKLLETLKKRGINELFIHQEEAFKEIKAGKHVVVVTPTASGKTLCYNLPVLDEILRNPETRALYIFPTKALSNDQLGELTKTIEDMGAGIRVYTYDGDTASDARKVVRQSAQIVITNPDMLHQAILPHHTKWISLFENLKYVVIDELHTYRGVFGSHMAQVIRRLKRVAAYYGSRPQFIMASATIANPEELASMLTGEDVVAITRNGAPGVKRHFILYNPPIFNAEMGIRKSSLLEAQRIAAFFIEKGLKTIVFARSRARVELLGKYLKDNWRNKGRIPAVASYRGGYLPSERRKIETGLKEGEIDGIVTTNALELGIDIGGLDASVVCGFPGTIASLWQQWGRAGRAGREAVSVMVADSSPLDQFLVRNHDYFFKQSPERGLINPDNLIIRAEHMKCACFELPVTREEASDDPWAAGILEYLEDCRFVHLAGDRYYWMGDHFPAHEISLRSASSDNFVIMDVTNPGSPKVIGEMDRSSVPVQLFPDAIYLHQGNAYQVKELDFEGGRAYVEAVVADYYTDAELAVEIKVLDEFARRQTPSFIIGRGEVVVSQMATVYKKIKYRTHENVGNGMINLPQEDLHTSIFWISLAEDLIEGMGRQQVERVLLGLANLFHNLAPLLLMCDYNDLRVIPQVKAVHTTLPTVFAYDSYPGGIGLADALFEDYAHLIKMALTTVKDCGCASGCPSCVGPVTVVGEDGKRLAMKILEDLYASTQG